MKVASKKIKYTGFSDVVELDAAAWKNVGVEDQKKVTFDRSNNFTESVSTAAAKWLLENDSENFVDADKNPDAKTRALEVPKLSENASGGGASMADVGTAATVVGNDASTSGDTTATGDAGGTLS